MLEKINVTSYSASIHKVNGLFDAHAIANPAHKILLDKLLSQGLLKDGDVGQLENRTKLLQIARVSEDGCYNYDIRLTIDHELNFVDESGDELVGWLVNDYDTRLSTYSASYLYESLSKMAVRDRLQKLINEKWDGLTEGCQELLIELNNVLYSSHAHHTPTVLTRIVEKGIEPATKTGLVKDSDGKEFKLVRFICKEYSLGTSSGAKITDTVKWLQLKRDLTVDVLSGDKVIEAYMMLPIKFGGMIRSSCMRHNTGMSSIYANNPDKVKLLRMYDKDKKLCARALMWIDVENARNSEVYPMLDRVYTSGDGMDVGLRALHNYMDTTYPDGWYERSDSLHKNGTKVDIEYRLVVKNIRPTWYMPYMDTLSRMTVNDNDAGQGSRAVRHIIEKLNAGDDIRVDLSDSGGGDISCRDTGNLFHRNYADRNGGDPIVECNQCGEKHTLNWYQMYKGYPVCDECYRRLMRVCETCGKHTPREFIPEVDIEDPNIKTRSVGTRSSITGLYSTFKEIIEPIEPIEQCYNHSCRTNGGGISMDIEQIKDGWISIKALQDALGRHGKAYSMQSGRIIDSSNAIVVSGSLHQYVAHKDSIKKSNLIKCEICNTYHGIGDCPSSVGISDLYMRQRDLASKSWINSLALRVELGNSDSSLTPDFLPDHMIANKLKAPAVDEVAPAVAPVVAPADSLFTTINGDLD